VIPPRSVLAAVDFSEPSRTALALAARLAVHCEAELHVIHAVDPLLAAAARTQGVDLAAETREELTAFLRQSSLPPGLAVLERIVIGPAASVICDAAVRDNIDVVVVGARGMSGGERLMFGSAAEGVLRRTQKTVLVVPPSWTPAVRDSSDLSGLGPVIAAIDFTAPSLDAVSSAARLAATLGTSLELVHVVAPLAVAERWRVHAERSMARRLQDARAELAPLAKAAAAVDARVLTGTVADALAQEGAAAPGRHPLLVLGRRRPGERGAAPGATAYRVLTLARSPVLMYLADT
jgi:nucleotide-binding universal stress UspA family protein